MSEISTPIHDKPVKLVEQVSLKVKAEHLRQTHILQFVSDTLIDALAETMEPLEYPAGQQIIKKGDQGDCMYFIAEGSVNVHDGETHLATLFPGQMFGEVSALSPQCRTASVTTDSNTLLYSLKQESFYKALFQNPSDSCFIIQGLCQHEGKIIEENTARAVKSQLLEQELALGQKIQQGFLPQKKLRHQNWEIETSFKAARVVAGDFYDYFDLKSINRIAVVIGDVCDKGVGAALFMSLFRTLIRSSALAFEDLITEDIPDNETILAHCMQQANQYVATTHAKDSMFASIFFALINPDNGEFSYINAGHEPPYLTNKQGICQRLETTGPVVGLFSGAHYLVKQDVIEEGEMLLVVTDGVSEAKNLNAEEFGEDRILQTIKAVGPIARDAVTTLKETLAEFTDGVIQFDDITMLAVGRHFDISQTLT